MESSTKASNCEICNAKFGFTRRTHQCKRCKRNVCANCGRGKRIIAGYTDNIQHRTCDVCEQDVQFQLKLRHSNGLAWNTLSDIGKEWIAVIPNLKQMKEETPYNLLIQEADKIGQNEENFNEIEADLNSGATDRSSFNHSLYEFLHYIQGSSSPQQCRTQIRNVLRAHCMRNPTIGYVQGLNLIVTFLLCFLDEENSFCLLTHLIENILPPHFYSKIEKGVCFYGYQAESYVIKKILQEQLNLKKKEDISAMEDFIDVVLPSLLMPLLVDTLNVSCLFTIWDKMIKAADFVVLEKSLLTILSTHKSLLIDRDLLAGRRYQEIFCKEVTNEFMQIKAKPTTATMEQIVNLRKEFELSFADELEKRSQKSAQVLTQAKRFSKFEIEVLYSEYQSLVKSRGGKKTSVSREDFKVLLGPITSHQKGGALIKLLKVFDLFDVACSMLLMKESFEEKMIFCFKNHDKSQKNYLTIEEYQTFLETLSRVCIVVMRDESDACLLRKIAGFRKEMTDAVKAVPKIKYADVQDKLNKDDLILTISRALEGQRKKSSVVAEASRLSLIEKKDETSKKEEEESKNQEVPAETIAFQEARKESEKAVMSLISLNEEEELRTTRCTLNDYSKVSSILSLEGKEQEVEPPALSPKYKSPSSILETDWEDFPCLQSKILERMSQKTSHELQEHEHPNSVTQIETRTKEISESSQVIEQASQDKNLGNYSHLTALEKRHSKKCGTQKPSSITKRSVALTQSESPISLVTFETDNTNNVSELMKASEKSSDLLSCHSPAKLSSNPQIPKILLKNPAECLAEEQAEESCKGRHTFSTLHERISSSLSNHPQSSYPTPNIAEINKREDIAETMAWEEGAEDYRVHKENEMRNLLQKNSGPLEPHLNAALSVREEVERWKERLAEDLEFDQVNDVAKPLSKPENSNIKNDIIEYDSKREAPNDSDIVDKAIEARNLEECTRSPSESQQLLAYEKMISKTLSNHMVSQPSVTSMPITLKSSPRSQNQEEECKSESSQNASARSFKTVYLEPPQSVGNRGQAEQPRVRWDSEIITDMRQAPKAQLDAIRESHRDKSATLSCKGCSIF